MKGSCSISTLGSSQAYGPRFEFRRLSTFLLPLFLLTCTADGIYYPHLTPDILSKHSPTTPHLLAFTVSWCPRSRGILRAVEAVGHRAKESNDLVVGIVDGEAEDSAGLVDQFRVGGYPWVVLVGGKNEEGGIRRGGLGNGAESGGARWTGEGVGELVSWVNRRVGKVVLEIDDAHGKAKLREEEEELVEEEKVAGEVDGKAMPAAVDRAMLEDQTRMRLVWMHRRKDLEYEIMKEIFREVAGMFSEGESVVVGLIDVDVEKNRRLMEEFQITTIHTPQVFLFPACVPKNGRCPEVRICGELCTHVEDVIMFVNRYLMEKMGLVGQDIIPGIKKKVQDGSGAETNLGEETHSQSLREDGLARACSGQEVEDGGNKVKCEDDAIGAGVSGLHDLEGSAGLEDPRSFNIIQRQSEALGAPRRTRGLNLAGSADDSNQELVGSLHAVDLTDPGVEHIVKDEL